MRFPSIRSNSSMVLIWSTWKLSPGWFSVALSRASVLSDSFLISDNIFSSLKRTLRWNPKYMEIFWVYVEINGNIYRAYFRKGTRAIFQKKAKYLKLLAKMYTFWKYFEKWQPRERDSRTHETARVCFVIEIYRISNTWKDWCSSQSSTSLLLDF